MNRFGMTYEIQPGVPEQYAREELRHRLVQKIGEKVIDAGKVVVEASIAAKPSYPHPLLVAEARFTPVKTHNIEMPRLQSMQPVFSGRCERPRPSIWQRFVESIKDDWRATARPTRYSRGVTP